jgi:hypothetical protein
MPTQRKLNRINFGSLTENIFEVIKSGVRISCFKALSNEGRRLDLKSSIWIWVQIGEIEGNLANRPGVNSHVKVTFIHKIFTTYFTQMIFFSKNTCFYGLKLIVSLFMSKNR